MTAPANATSKRGVGRFYRHPGTGEEFASVTTILKAAPKPALVPWAAKMAAEFAVDNLDQVAALLKSGQRQAAIDLIKGSPYRSADKAADLGSAIHARVEAHILGTPILKAPAEQQPFMDQFERWLTDFDPTFDAAEVTVLNRTHGYAGTLDMIATIKGLGCLLIDVKTGKGIYGEVGLQMAAYRYGEAAMLRSGYEEPLDAVDGCAVLHLRSDKCDLIPVRADGVVFDAFLAIKKVWEWEQGLSRDVVGQVIAPPLGVSA